MLYCWNAFLFHFKLNEIKFIRKMHLWAADLRRWVAPMKNVPNLICQCQMAYSALDSLCLTSSTCEQEPCYSGHLVFAPSKVSFDGSGEALCHWATSSWCSVKPSCGITAQNQSLVSLGCQETCYDCLSLSGPMPPVSVTCALVSDESRFCSWQLDGRVTVWRRRREHYADCCTERITVM